MPYDEWRVRGGNDDATGSTRILADGTVAWAAVAANVGYADQAHLSRDFALAGVTPGGLREERVRSVQADQEPGGLTSAA